MAYKRKKDQPKKDHYSDTAKEIADIFIKALEEETLPWHSGFDKFRYIKPFNPANGTVYQGMNSFNFALKSYIRGYRDPRFMTMSQANELGGKVKKGEHCIWGFNFKPTLVLVKDEEGNPVLDDNAEKISDYIMNFDPEYVKTKEACQNQKLLTDSEPITQQNLETAVADAKTLTSQRENDDVVKQLSAIVEEAEKDYREIYNKGKLSKANEVVQKLNNSYPLDSGYDKSLFSVLYFKRNAPGVGFKDESFEHISYDIGSEPKNSDLSTHIRDYVDGVLKGDEDFLYTSEYSQQKELKERKARLADYKEQIVPVFEQYSKECSKAQNQIIEAVAEPVESKETPQSLTDLFANFDKAEQTPNNNINQTATDKTPVAPLLDDEVKVVGFNNDSDLTVLNSPTQSHKSPDIER